MSEWQPIETAPKDGTDILLYFPAGTATQDATWVTEGAWLEETDRFKSGWETWMGIVAEPSHWMPLPEPPK